ncbi:Plasmodium exported protein (Pm-fam-a like), unknown function [Plasmodium malariae]|uniref:Fam-l protein n=1 Tax=Plasmodium malariae TaxID=5858 RepID=A0A1A8WKI4_PLAMA|nr:Plasmodium exported protein (Pm-fam-a like), unknown function [Plasmodium malariae]
MIILFKTISSLNKNLVEKCNLSRKLYSRDYRLLAKYKQDKDSIIENFKEEMPNNELKEKKIISNIKKGTNKKDKQSCKSSLDIKKHNRNVEKNKCGIPKTKKYFDIEKKIFKKLNYEDYVKNIRIIENKEYKKLARKKRRIRIALLLLFFFVLILPILDLSLEKITDGGLLGLLGLLSPTGSGDTGGTLGVEGRLVTLLSEGTWGNIEKIYLSTLFFYGIPFLLFVVIFILGMVYYYKKVIKYENIKFIKRLNKK